MAKITELSDLFLAAADIEAETPITIGVNKAGPDGFFTNLQPMKPQECMGEQLSSQGNEAAELLTPDGRFCCGGGS